MTCANWVLTILAAIVLVINIWPSWFGATVNMWISIIVAILIVVTAWTGVGCKWCETQQKTTVKKK